MASTIKIGNGTKSNVTASKTNRTGGSAKSGCARCGRK